MCMCGDICCNWCGPAQGNWKCEVCDEWASEGCAHVDENTGEYKPECEQLVKASIQEKNRDWADYYKKQGELELDDFPSDFQAEEPDQGPF